jgi:hypothetical protein
MLRDWDGCALRDVRRKRVLLCVLQQLLHHGQRHRRRDVHIEDRGRHSVQRWWPVHWRDVSDEMLRDWDGCTLCDVRRKRVLLCVLQQLLHHGQWHSRRDVHIEDRGRHSVRCWWPVHWRQVSDEMLRDWDGCALRDVRRKRVLFCVLQQLLHHGQRHSRRDVHIEDRGRHSVQRWWPVHWREVSDEVLRDWDGCALRDVRRKRVLLCVLQQLLHHGQRHSRRDVHIEDRGRHSVRCWWPVHWREVSDEVLRDWDGCALRDVRRKRVLLCVLQQLLHHGQRHSRRDVHIEVRGRHSVQRWWPVHW